MNVAGGWEVRCCGTAVHCGTSGPSSLPPSPSLLSLSRSRSLASCPASESDVRVERRPSWCCRCVATEAHESKRVIAHMSEVSSDSSSDGSSSDDEESGAFDFLASITAPSASSSIRSGSGSQLASPTVAQQSPVHRGSRLVPARSSDSDGAASAYLSERSASDGVAISPKEAAPDELEQRFKDLLQRNLEEYASAVAAAAELACRSMQSRVAERLRAMLDDGTLPESGAALVEQTNTRCESLRQEVGATHTWQKHYELVMAGISADNVAQLKVIEEAAQSEAQQIVRRTRLESKSKLELSTTVAKSKLENAKVSIQRTASEREESIACQIKHELAAAAAAAELTGAEVAMRAAAGKKAKKELIENEEEAKMIKRKMAVLEDRIKHQRQALALVSQKVRQKDEEVAACEHRLQARSGIQKLSDASFAEEARRQQLARALSFQQSVAGKRTTSMELVKGVKTLANAGGFREDKTPTKLPSI